MKTRRHFLLATALLLTASSAYAERNAPLKPVLAQPGKVVFEDSFAAAALGKPWSVAKGEWTTKDGVLTGKEKASDKHAAVLMLAKPNKDSIIQFSFKLDGAKGFDLSFNSSRGHLFRVTAGTDGIALNKDKDKKDKDSKADMLGKAGLKIEPGKWITMLVEVKGDKVSVQTDNGAKIQGGATGLAVEKTGYRFVARGESVSIADLKVWEAK